MSRITDPLPFEDMVFWHIEANTGAHVLSFEDGVFRHAEENTDIEDEILSFERLPNGWHYGEGRSATKRAIELALEVNLFFAKHSARAVEVFPDVSGGILISGYYENETLEVFCTQDGQINMLHEGNDEDVVYEREGVSLDILNTYMEGLLWTSTKSYGFSIRGISVEKRSVSKVWPSKILQMVVYQSSIHNVLKNLAALNVNIYSNSIIPIPQEILSYSGELVERSYQRIQNWNTNYPPAGMSAI